MNAIVTLPLCRFMFKSVPYWAMDACGAAGWVHSGTDDPTTGVRLHVNGTFLEFHPKHAGTWGGNDPNDDDAMHYGIVFVGAVVPVFSVGMTLAGHSLFWAAKQRADVITATEERFNTMDGKVSVNPAANTSATH